MDKSWYMQMMEYYIVVRMEELLLLKPWMNLTKIILHLLPLPGKDSYAIGSMNSAVEFMVNEYY